MFSSVRVAFNLSHWDKWNATTFTSMITSPTFTFRSVSTSLKEKGLELRFPMPWIVTKPKRGCRDDRQSACLKWSRNRMRPKKLIKGCRWRQLMKSLLQLKGFGTVSPAVSPCRIRIRTGLGFKASRYILSLLREKRGFYVTVALRKKPNNPFSEKLRVWHTSESSLENEKKPFLLILVSANELTQAPLCSISHLGLPVFFNWHVNSWDYTPVM